jgi:hypothetical protein
MVFPAGTPETAGGFDAYIHSYYDLLFLKKVLTGADRWTNEDLIKKYYKSGTANRNFNPPQILKRIDGSKTLLYSNKGSKKIMLSSDYNKLPKNNDNICNDVKNEKTQKYVIPIDCGCR